MSDGDRRSRLLQLAAGAAFLALAVVLVLIVLTASEGEDGGDAEVEGGPAVAKLLAGIPQRGMVLGDPQAPVRLVEFGDLQCPFCANYAEEILPPVMETRVRNGEVRVEFRNYAIIGEESVTAGAAALAAGAQGRGWSFVELFYRNQGAENAGYAGDDTFLEALARAAGVEDLPRWNADRERLAPQVEETSQEAQELGFDGTPSFAIEGPGTNGLEPLGTPRTTGDLEAAIEDAS